MLVSARIVEIVVAAWGAAWVIFKIIPLSAIPWPVILTLMVFCCASVLGLIAIVTFPSLTTGSPSKRSSPATLVAVGRSVTYLFLVNVNSTEVVDAETSFSTMPSFSPVNVMTGSVVRPLIIEAGYSLTGVCEAEA